MLLEEYFTRELCTLICNPWCKGIIFQSQASLLVPMSSCVDLVYSAPAQIEEKADTLRQRFHRGVAMPFEYSQHRTSASPL